MNIILLPKASGRALSLQLNRWYHCLLPAALVLFLISAFVITGFYFGIRHGHEPIIAEWEQTLSQQQQQLTSTREMTEAHMHALTQRIGQLQAHVNRLDALGNRLVQMANLDRRNSISHIRQLSADRRRIRKISLITWWRLRKLRKPLTTWPKP